MTKRRNDLTIAYRYRPGAIGDGGTLDNGAVVTQEFVTRRSRDKRLAALRSDPRVQWSRICGDTSSATSSYANQAVPSDAATAAVAAVENA